MRNLDWNPDLRFFVSAMRRVLNAAALTILCPHSPHNLSFRRSALCASSRNTDAVWSIMYPPLCTSTFAKHTPKFRERPNPQKQQFAIVTVLSLETPRQSATFVYVMASWSWMQHIALTAGRSLGLDCRMRDVEARFEDTAGCGTHGIVIGCRVQRDMKRATRLIRTGNPDMEVVNVADAVDLPDGAPQLS